MTPERLAEIEQWCVSPLLAGLNVNTREAEWIHSCKNTAKVLIAHIRDLEAQVREAREALSLAYLELGDGAHPGFREANRAAMAVYERYFDHHDPTGKTIHELREAALATLTPPSPEVKR